MTEAGAWCTNWGAYNVPAMWQMLAGENDQRGWDQTVTWGRLADQVDSTKTRLTAARQALVEKWPPQPGSASEVFVAVLDELLRSMTATTAAALSTQVGLSGIMQSLASAKAEMEPLYREWQKKSGDLVLRSIDGAEDELNETARKVMVKSENAVASYARLISIPPRFAAPLIAPGSSLQDGTGSSDGAGSQSGIRVPSTTETLASPGGSATPHNAPIPVPHDPPSSLPDKEPVLTAGPILSSTLVPPPGGPGSPGPPGTPAPIGPGLPAGNAGPPPSSPWLGPGVVIRPALPGGGASVRSSVPSLPPGGLIGGAAGPRGERAVGGTLAYRSPDGHAVSVSGVSGQRGFARDRKLDADPDSPWTVAKGVPPVIEPPPIPTWHDPGPGVIGIDR